MNAPTLFADKPTTQGLTASDMVQMLERHYLPQSKPPGGLFAAEIQSPCGKRRADALWFPTTIAGGRGLVGHEIKVSRADVISELKDPSKADPWAQYCTRWWLVVSDPAIIDGLDIPEAWGIMSPPSGRRTVSMTVVRPAPTLEPVDRARGVERLLSWLSYRARERESELERELRSAKDTAEQWRRKADLLEAHGAGGDHSEMGRYVAQVGLAYRTATTERWRVGDYDVPGGSLPRVDDVVCALVDMAALRAAAQAMESEIDDRIRALRRLLQPIGEGSYSEALKKLAKGAS